MTLRKLILNLTLFIFIILMYTVVQTYVSVNTLADAAGVNLAEYLGSMGKALLMWAQFPLLLLLGVLLAYLSWGDKSLTQSEERAKKA